MHILLFDQTFEGLLTAIFEAYRHKHFPEQLLAPDDVLPLFTTSAITVHTAPQKASRVWNTLKKKCSSQTTQQLIFTWCAQHPQKNILLFNVIRKLVDSPASIENNLNDSDILLLHQLYKKVNKERLHIMQFVRFQKTLDEIYFAPINPQHDALPLVIPHFKDRFADQKWIIYDMTHRYGYFYDLHTASEITLDWEEHFENEQLKPDALAADEHLIQTSWQKYFKALTIQERLNPKLHKQNMPRRFWKYLPEKADTPKPAPGKTSNHTA